MGRIVLWGAHVAGIGIILAALAAINKAASFAGIILLHLSTGALLYFAVLLLAIGFACYVLDLGLVGKKKNRLRFEPVKKPRIAVGMTAYNDEGVIGKAVKDFVSAEGVSKVIVIDNNCTDRTAIEARSAGALVVKEQVQGYGAACKRALAEARKYGNIVCLVEGDQTFASADLKKLLAYIENCDMVVGTRTTAELAAPDSQLTWFMRYGNLFVAKLLQLRYWGTRFTDVGCTYRLIRAESLGKIIGKLEVKGNHFSPHMIMKAMEAGLKIIEVPVTIRRRAGVSKGVGKSVTKGLANGLQMWIMILFQ